MKRYIYILIAFTLLITALMVVTDIDISTDAAVYSGISADGGKNYEIPIAKADDGAQVSETEPEPERKDGNIVFSFVGDVMLASYRGEYNWNTFNYWADEKPAGYFFSGVYDIFASDDYTVANLENVFTDRDLPELGKGYDGAYWYKSASKNAGILTAGSIEIVSLANNHMYDYGEEGKSDTISAAEAAGIEWGDNDRAVIIEKYGVKIALLCVTVTSNGNFSKAYELMESLPDDIDYRIVYFHGGIERVHTPPDGIVEGARAIADMGVNLIIGHHPHVLQPAEQYNGVKIVYSLGNFLFGAGRGENRTAIYRLTLNVSDGVIMDASDEIIPCYCYDERWQPAVIEDEEKRSAVLSFMRGERETPF